MLPSKRTDSKGSEPTLQAVYPVVVCVCGRGGVMSLVDNRRHLMNNCSVSQTIRRIHFFFSATKIDFMHALSSSCNNTCTIIVRPTHHLFFSPATGRTSRTTTKRTVEAMTQA